MTLSQSNKKILLVEDDPELLDMMKTKLSLSGLEFEIAETGQEALDYLKQNRPVLILLDILLPDIDGLTILTELAKKEETKTIPVIILSNLADQGSLEQAAAIGPYEYLVKAKTDLNELVKKIKAKIEANKKVEGTFNLSTA